MKHLILILLFVTNIIFAQEDLLYFYDDEDGYKNNETNLYLAGQTVSGTQASRIDRFVTMLKDSLSISSLSEKFDVMYLLANENETLALRNLVKRQHDATAVNSPTFTQWEGFQGDGTTSYLNTNYNPSAQGENFTQNDASYGFYSRSTPVSAGGSVLFGGSDGTTHSYLTYLNGSTGARLYLNGSTYVGEIYNRSINGLRIAVRTSSSAVQGYQNGGDALNGTLASNGVPNTNFLIFKGASTDYHLAQASIIFVGKSFTEAETKKITNCIEWYMDDLGKGVIP